MKKLKQSKFIFDHNEVKEDLEYILFREELEKEALEMKLNKKKQLSDCKHCNDTGWINSLERCKCVRNWDIRY